ncbi:hypothetical protein SHJG_7378 [Streptomyces hygroscopicus subsp. jinggangensis 5008]|nr:hypothetical protein SHJG_7378 [Streptomyces hygroscopicus subsp. jinggangensis 5008]AGF66800.1 hypothetical protein SHJGH_7138 [Streptomyces hygroscopicus subsp. jinggangensis TL01]
MEVGRGVGCRPGRPGRQQRRVVPSGPVRTRTRSASWWTSSGQVGVPCRRSAWDGAAGAPGVVQPSAVVGPRRRPGRSRSGSAACPSRRRGRRCQWSAPPPRSGVEAEFGPDRFAGVPRGDPPASGESVEELQAKTAGLGVRSGAFAGPAITGIADGYAQPPPVPGELDQGRAGAVADGIGDQFRDEQFGGLDHPVLAQRAAETVHAVTDPVPGGGDTRRDCGEARLAGWDGRFAVHQVPPARVALGRRRPVLRAAGGSHLSGYPCLPGEPSVSAG